MKTARTVVSIARATGAGLLLAALAACHRAPPAPDVGYVLLDGRQQRLADLRGHVVLVHFWATGCAPCVAEMPRLAQTWRRFAPQGFETLAVSVRDDPPAQVINFARSRKLPFGVVIDLTGEVAGRFGRIDETPTSVLVDARGREVARWSGPTDFDALDRRLARLVGG
jgi:peroxiredoxin